MSFARRVGKNFAIQTVGKGLSVFIGLGLIALLTRALGPAAFGEYTTAINFLQFFGVIVDFGLTLTLVVMMSERGADESRVAGNIFGLRMVSAALVFGLTPLIAIPFPYSSSVKMAIAVGALAYFFMAGATMLVGIYQKHQAMWRASLAEVIGRVVLFGLTAYFTFHSYGLVAMMWALVVSNIVWLFLTLRFAQPLVPLRPRFEMAVWKDALARSWPIALSIVFNLVYLRGDVLILAFFRESTEVGFYGVAYRLLDVLTTIPVMFMGLILPTLTARWTSHDQEGFARLTNRTFDLFVIALLPIVFGVLGTAERLVNFIAGPGYEPAIPLMQLLILTVPAIFMGGLYGHVVVAIGAQRRMIAAYAFTAVLSIFGYIILIPQYGAVGAGIVTIVSETLIGLLTFGAVYRASKAMPNLGMTAKAFLAALVMYAVLRAVPTLSFPLALILAVVVYVFGLFILGVLRRSYWQSVVTAAK